MNAVLDASALLALVFNEPGSGLVEDVVEQACVSAINFSEVLSKVIDQGGNAQQVSSYFKSLGLNIIAFDDALALLTAELKPDTANLGLGITDRACLALGQSLAATVYTADRVWAELELGMVIKLIR